MRIFIAALCAVGLYGPATVWAFETSQPNVVIILADDMGYGDVRALNPNSRIATPHLDQLAADGMLFTDGHSPSAVCTPTRYALLTGRYCWRSRLKRGVLGGYSEPLLEPGRKTIADMLRARGYHTGAVGKWHLGMALPKLKEKVDVSRWDGDPGIDFAGVITDSPIHHGFDRYFGVSASLDMAPYVYIRDDRFTKMPELQQKAIGFPHFIRKGPRASDFEIDGVLDRLKDEAVAFITEAAGNDKPFFLYLPLTAPHKPTQPHERFRGKTGLGEYGDFVAQVDWTVGEVLKSLDKAGVSDDTLVVYTSDNGSYMFRYSDSESADHVTDSRKQGFFARNHTANGPLRGTKADVWEAGHRVPLIVRWPGKVKGGTTCSTAVCLTDLYSTCAEITGATLDENSAEDSLSLVKLLNQTSKDRGAPVINHSINGMFAIRNDDWKLVAGTGSGGRQNPRGKPFEKPYQLFNLVDDVGETDNVAAEHPEMVERMTRQLEELRASGRTRPE